MTARQTSKWFVIASVSALFAAGSASAASRTVEVTSSSPLVSGANSSASIVVAEAEEHGKAKGKEKEKEAEPPPMPTATPVELTPGEQYCSNVFDAASAARLAQQKGVLAEAQKQIDVKIAALAAKTDELKAWIKKRDDFTAQATDALVQIYSKMKADAAAKLLMAMDEVTAAAVVSKLSPKTNSLILTEMDATKAARLSAIIASLAEIAMKPERKADAR